MVLDDSACDSVRTAGLSSTAAMDNGETEYDKILFASDRMYCHWLARFNYTTYDIRRAQDVVNARTSYCNIMLLGNQEGHSATSNHRFLYSRVLGLYHVNVVYIGSGMLNYVPQMLHFLWV
jgi:hypothetical protein